MDPKRDPEHPSVAKVTIIYARNPEDYCLPAPPMHPDELELPEHEEERVRYLEEVGRAKLALKDGIRQHHALVKSLADFLCKYNVPVAHEQLTRDQGVDNLLKWVQKQVDDSDFVILVITPSLNVFLLERPPPEDEPLFVGDYLYNLINNRPPHLKGVLPVFINQVREHDIFPKSLEASTSYEIHQPFELDGSRQRSDDLHELYAVLTGQVLNPKPEACGVVKLRVQKKRCMYVCMCMFVYILCVYKYVCVYVCVCMLCMYLCVCVYIIASAFKQKSLVPALFFFAVFLLVSIHT